MSRSRDDLGEGPRPSGVAQVLGVCAVACALVLLLSGCGMLGFSSEDAEGYLLRSEDGGPGAGTLYVTYGPGEQPGTLTGYVHTAYPAENPEGAYLQTERVTGSVDGTRVFFRLESNPQAEYTGTVEGDAMELRSGLSSWEGEAATYEEFGEAAGEMAEAAEEGNFAD